MKTYYINRLDKYFDGYHILSAKDENGYYVWVSLGDNEKILFDEFSKIFREEQLKEDVLANEQLIAWLLYPFEFFKNEYRQKGTEFQESVWNIISNIPSGSVMSYSEIAKEIGKPTAWRAVANACGANKLSLIIPCHRTVPSNGKVGGYAWGSELKRKLLLNEGVNLKI